jgi:hypothetical protein
MSISGRVVCFVITFACGVLAAFSSPPEMTVVIDCDRGDSLQRAVDFLERRGRGVVQLTGTCDAVHVHSPFLEIVGDSPATSRIEAGVGAAVTAVEPGYIQIRNVYLAGDQGLYVTGAERVVSLVGCEIGGNHIGVRAGPGAGVIIEDSALTGELQAIRVQRGEVVVESSVLENSDFGARVLDGKLSLINTVVTGNSVGMQALDRSTVTVAGGSFAGNSQGHLSAITGSHLEVYNADIGGPDDGTAVALQASRGALVGVYADDPATEIWGAMIISDDSFIELDGAVLRGGIALRGFSRLLLNGTVADGVVDCQSAGDATCDFAASARTRGCQSAPPVCEPLDPAVDPGPMGFDPETTIDWRLDRTSNEDSTPTRAGPDRRN